MAPSCNVYDLDWASDHEIVSSGEEGEGEEEEAAEFYFMQHQIKTSSLSSRDFMPRVKGQAPRGVPHPHHHLVVL